jgi:hypothetical protein
MAFQKYWKNIRKMSFQWKGLEQNVFKIRRAEINTERKQREAYLDSSYDLAVISKRQDKNTSG